MDTTKITDQLYSGALGFFSAALPAYHIAEASAAAAGQTVLHGGTFGAVGSFGASLPFTAVAAAAPVLMLVVPALILRENTLKGLSLKSIFAGAAIGAAMPFALPIHTL
jgi:hypothetical protein